MFSTKIIEQTTSNLVITYACPYEAAFIYDDTVVNMVQALDNSCGDYATRWTSCTNQYACGAKHMSIGRARKPVTICWTGGYVE